MVSQGCCGVPHPFSIAEEHLYFLAGGLLRGGGAMRNDGGAVFSVEFQPILPFRMSTLPRRMGEKGGRRGVIGVPIDSAGGTIVSPGSCRISLPKEMALLA